MDAKKYKNPTYRYLWPLFAGFGIVIALLATNSDDTAQAIAQAAAGLVLVAFSVLMIRTGLTATRTGLIVRNAFSTKVISWEQVDSFDVDLFLVVRLTNGKAVRCSAVQPANASHITGRGYAYRVATELNSELADRRARLND
ncbi:PH domain-containing protein [Kitasatospora griseola]|uniref:PH domain-containing protein n=1 Tax=Kitasatospora griseola TaxID=2064 RepID=UPI0036662DB7